MVAGDDGGEVRREHRVRTKKNELELSEAAVHAAGAAGRASRCHGCGD
jgi:hypothetical protein